MDGLKNPHGGQAWQSALVATSTTAGMVMMKTFDRVLCYDLSNLEGKPDSLAAMEWIQNTKISGNTFISIDSNRSAFQLFDPVAEKRISIPFNPDWAIQDISTGSIDQEVMKQAGQLNQY